MKNKLKLLMMLTVLVISVSSCKKTTTTTTTDDTPTSVTDADGNVYGVVKIGNQYWMTENLRVTKYNDGTPITTGLDNTTWTNATTGAYAIYNDDAANNTVLGKLYNWHAVSTDKLAPTGWHVPTKAECDILVNTLGGGTVAGGKLKSTSSLWQAPNTGADNSSGFNALPSGFRGMTGGYSSYGTAAYFWNRDEVNAGQAKYLLLQHDFVQTFSNGATKTFGYAVRCIKN